MRLPFIIAMLLAINSSARAQDTLRGTIVDSQSMEGLPGVNIFSEDKFIGVTDASGNFRIATTPTPLECRLLGYRTCPVTHPRPDMVIRMHVAPLSINEVVVTASRYVQDRKDVPLSIEKIQAGVIAETKPTALNEIMNKVPGVIMLNLNNEQHGMSIRQPMGTSPYYLYMEDGIPLRTMGVFNHNALLEANLLSISSIEVVKGPASSLYGPEAVGGAVNLITLSPSPVLSARMGLQADNWGYRRMQLNAAGPISKKVGFTLGGSLASQKNSWMKYSDYDKNSVNARIDYSLTLKTRLILAGTYNEYYSQTPGTTDSIAFYSRQYSSSAQFTYRQVEAARGRATVQHQWNNRNSTELHVFYRANSIKQNPAYGIRWTKGQTFARGEINENTFTSRGAILQHVSELPVLRTRIVSGISTDHSPVHYNAYQLDLNARLRPGGKSVEEYQIQAERPEIRLSHYDAILNNTAAYIQAELKPFKKVTFVTGARYDMMAFRYRNHLDAGNGYKQFQKITPRLGATFRVRKQVTLFANYGLGFSPPSLTTIFTRKPGSATDAFYYDLQPATFRNYEAGGWSTLMNKRMSVSIAIYQMNGRNELLNVRQPDNSIMYQSAGKTLHRGVEYSMVYHPDKQWMLRAGGTNAVHRYEEFALSNKSTDQIRDVNGNNMPSAPSWIFNVEIIYRPVFLKGFRIGAEWQHMSKWYQDQTNTAIYSDKGVFGLAGISLLNFRAGYEYQSFEFFCNILNITNELYANNVTRNNLPGSAAVFTPGAPRTFIFGIQYNFMRKR